MNHQATGEPRDIAATLPPIPYPDDLYRFDTVADGISGSFEAVTEADIRYFHQHGYLVIQDAFSPDEVRDALAGMVYLMDGKNPDFRAIQFEPKLAKLKDEMSAEDPPRCYQENFQVRRPRTTLKGDGGTYRAARRACTNYGGYTAAFSRHGVG